MVRLVQDMGAGDHPAQPVLVASNDPAAGGLAKAAALGVPTAAVDHRAYPGDRAAFEAALLEPLLDARPDIICLAGFMRILTPGFVQHFAGRMVNIHPSLLPAFPGAHAVQDALDYGVKVTGCTVHVVDAGVDTGPILAQAAVPVLDTDTEAELHERIKVQERALLLRVLGELSRR